MTLEVSSITPRRFGLTNVLLDCGSLEKALALHQILSNSEIAGVDELIPAAQTVLVRCSSVSSAQEFLKNLEDLVHQAQDSKLKQKFSEERLIEVLYAGEDLSEVARQTGLSVEAVIDEHTCTSYSVAFAGFAPGFFYLHSDNRALDVTRRATPRTAVPAGSVGLAGEFSGIYPRTSPGGWQLIGRTVDPLWDINQNPPALLAPGQKVRFRAVRELIEIPQKQQPEKEKSTPALTVRATGAQLLYQDQGRRGLTHWGVSPSGYADPAAAYEANRLVGNQDGALVLESLMGGYALEAHQDVVLAATGANCELTITGAHCPEAKNVPLNAPFALLSGQKLTASFASCGLRNYLAVRGGFSALTVAESESTDTLAHLGEGPLDVGAHLSIGEQAISAVQKPTSALVLPRADEVTEIRVIMGPRDDWFTEESLHNFRASTWKVTSESNRIGVRLEPAETSETALLRRAIDGELPSEGMVSGAIQVPPSGLPVVFLADHPVTGGYPVIATVHTEDLRLLAQSQPGTLLRFSPE